MPFAFREENGYFRIDKCERLAYKARFSSYSMRAITPAPSMRNTTK